MSEAPVDVKQIPKEPYELPAGLVWSDVDLKDEDRLDELYVLLNKNYVEDTGAEFRFDYSKEVLKWCLMPPGWRKEWHCGLRSRETDELVGFIGAIPCKMQVREKCIDMVEINFLCLHKSLRSKKLAPTLIKEITRRVNLTGIFQAVYTAGVKLSKPISTSQYWHRSLNVEKLIQCKFTSLGQKTTLKREQRYYELPKEIETHVVPLDEAHVESACKLIASYLEKFQLHPIFSLDEFKHYFLPRKGVIYTYVILNNKDEVTDFISFYSLPSSVANNSMHDHIKAAYSYYNFATSVNIVQLMESALILARDAGFDVFNALDLMDNNKFLERLQFKEGTGLLKYYLYNWDTPTMKPGEVGLVLQ